MTISFKRKLIQAPLAGYSCAPFRELAEQWGNPDFCCTEMLSAIQICSTRLLPKRYSYKSPKEGLLCAQLAGNNPDILAQAAEQVLEWGADYVDLNCGCPQPKIRKKQLGSRLLENSTRLYQLVSAIKRSVSIPIFVKIRVDSHSKDRYNQEVALAIQEAGASAITVHGRHWSEDYETPVNYHDIAMIKETVNIPVIGNGDIYDTHSAKKMFSETGCDAVMIARASVGQPWIFEKIYRELNGQSYTSPDIHTVGNLFIEHAHGLMGLEGEEKAVLQSRKLGKYYARNYLTSPDYFNEIISVKKYTDLVSIIKKYFQK